MLDSRERRELRNALRVHDEILNCECPKDTPCPGCEAKADQCLAYAKKFFPALLAENSELDLYLVCELHNFVQHFHGVMHLMYDDKDDD